MVDHAKWLHVNVINRFNTFQTSGFIYLFCCVIVSNMIQQQFHLHVIRSGLVTLLFCSKVLVGERPQ